MLNSDLHLHDNIQLSLALATFFIKISDTSRNHVLDASLLGMGRAPGNLKLELIAPVLNKILPMPYDIDPILSTLESTIQPIYDRKPWGYNVLYAHGALLSIDRTYAEKLLETTELDLVNKASILQRIFLMGPEARPFNPRTLQMAIKAQKESS